MIIIRALFFYTARSDSTATFKEVLPTRNFYRMPSGSSQGKSPPGQNQTYGVFKDGWQDIYSIKSGGTYPRNIDLLSRGFKSEWPEFKEEELPEGLKYQVSDRSLLVLNDTRGSTMNYTPKWDPKPFEEFTSVEDDDDIHIATYDQYYIMKTVKETNMYDPKARETWKETDGWIQDVVEFAKTNKISFLVPNANRQSIIDTVDNWTADMATALAKYAKYANIVAPEVFSSEGRCIKAEICGDYTYTSTTDASHPAASVDFLWLLDFYKRTADTTYRAVTKFLSDRSNAAVNLQNEEEARLKDLQVTNMKQYLDEQSDTIKDYISHCHTSGCRNMLNSNRLTIDDLHEMRRTLPGLAAHMAEGEYDGLYPKRTMPTNPLNPTLEDPLNIKKTYAPNIMYIRGLESNKDARKYSNRYFQQRAMYRKGVAPKMQTPKALKRERYWKAERNRYLDKQVGFSGTRATWNNFRGPCLWQDYYRTTGYRQRGYVFGNNKLRAPLRSVFKGRP